MKPLFRYSLILILFEILILAAGYIVMSILSPFFHFSDVAVPSIVFMLIAFISLYIFLRGQAMEPESRVMHSLVSISIKFLLEMIFIVFWFFIAKKTGLPSVILFFVLYLAFTLFLILVMLRTLKNRSL